MVGTAGGEVDRFQSGFDFGRKLEKRVGQRKMVNRVWEDRYPYPNEDMPSCDQSFPPNE